MFFVYVLFSHCDRKLYVGYTTDLSRRMMEHQDGLVPSTKDRRPLEQIYYEAYQSEVEAKRREKYLKGGNGRAVLKQQIPFTLKRHQYKFL